MVEEQVRGAASAGITPDADIISAWQADFEALKASVGVAGKIELTLPTGKKVKAVRIPLTLLLQQGAIPDHLSYTVSKFISGIESGDPEQHEKKIMESFTQGESAVANAQSWIELLNFVAANCVVTPRFVLDSDDADPDQGIFWIGTMNFYDKQWLFSWAQGVDQSVHEFLHEQITALGTTPYGQRLRLTPEQLLATGDAREFMVLLSDQSGRVAVGSVHPRQDRRDRSSARAEGQETSDASRTPVLAGSDTGHAAQTD